MGRFSVGPRSACRARLPVGEVGCHRVSAATPCDIRWGCLPRAPACALSRVPQEEVGVRGIYGGPRLKPMGCNQGLWRGHPAHGPGKEPGWSFIPQLYVVIYNMRCIMPMSG